MMPRFHIFSAGLSDPFSAIIHIIAALVLFVLSIYYLNKFKKTKKATIAILIFTIAQMLSFIMSALFHSFENLSITRLVFQYLDHSAIILCITGTSCSLLYMSYESKNKVFVILGLCLTAVVAIAMKVMFFNSVPDVIYISIGIGMGIVSFYCLKSHYPSSLMWYVYAGGAYYIFGGCIDTLVDRRSVILIERVIENHEVFHLFIFAGALKFFSLLIKSIYIKYNIDIKQSILP